MSATDEALRDLGQLEADLKARGDSQTAERVAAVAARLAGAGGVEDSIGPLITTGQAARMLGIRSVNTIKRWARDGLLEGFRRGGRVLVSERSVRKVASHPALDGQRAFEHELDVALAPFDAGDEPVPTTGQTWVGRKPWEHGVERGVPARV